MEAHLASCARCATELRHLRQGLALVDRLPEVEPSAAAVERIRAAARKTLDRQRRRRRPSFAHRYRYALAAAAMLIAVVGWSIIQDMVREPVVGDAPKLVEKWRETIGEVTDSTVLIDDLDRLQEKDPWVIAEKALLADARNSNTGDQLQEILDYLDLIEEELN